MVMSLSLTRHVITKWSRGKVMEEFQLRILDLGIDEHVIIITTRQYSRDSTMDAEKSYDFN